MKKPYSEAEKLYSSEIVYEKIKNYFNKYSPRTTFMTLDLRC